MRAAVSNPRIIQYSPQFNVKPDEQYASIRQNLCKDTNLYVTSFIYVS